MHSSISAATKELIQFDKTIGDVPHLSVGVSDSGTRDRHQHPKGNVEARMSRKAAPRRGSKLRKTTLSPSGDMPTNLLVARVERLGRFLVVEPPGSWLDQLHVARLRGARSRQYGSNVATDNIPLWRPVRLDSGHLAVQV
jgi:hypothetical protein